MLNSPVLGGLCQPLPIYIKGLIPSTAHFSAPGKSHCLFLVCKESLVEGKVLPSSALATAVSSAHRFAVLNQAVPGHVCLLQKIQHQPPAHLSPHQQLIVRLYPPFPKQFFFT